MQFYESAFAIVRPQLQNGKIKVIAITNTARAPNLPDLPTVAEAGFPGLTVDGLVGIFGPTGMSKAVKDKITADVKAVADDTIRDRLMTTGQLLNVGGADEFAKSLEEQRKQVADYAKKLGVAEMPQN